MSIRIYGKKTNDQIALLLDLMREAADHPVRRAWFTHSDLANRYYQGDMWTPEELAVLEARLQAPVVINLIQADYERFEGQYKRQKLATAFVGRNAPHDDKTADALSDLIRFIDQDTEYPFEESEVVRDGWVGGYGVMEVGVENGVTGGYRIFTRWEDPYAVFPDPYCRRYDWNDKRGGARYILRSKWIPVDEAKDKWPEQKKAIESALEMSPASQNLFSTIDPEISKNLIANYFDSHKRLIRPVEAWWKERTPKEVIYLKDGTCIDHYEPEEGKRVLKYVKGSYKDVKEVDQLYCAVFAGHIMIKKAEEAPYRTDLYPFIPFYVMRNKDGEPVGRAWRLIDPNREVNARRSRALYMMNSRKVLYEKGAIADKNLLAENMALADGQIELQPGYKDKFEIAENTDISEGNLKMLQESKAEFQMLSGEDYLQPSGEIRSGKGIAQAQLPYHLSQVGIFDNIRRTRRMRARLLVDLIKQYYDEDMIFQITDDNDKVKTVEMTAGLLDSLKERTFDIVLKDVTEYVNAQQEQYDTLQTTLPQIAQFGPAWAKILVSTSEIKNKDTIIKQLESMEKTPPSPPKPSITIKWEELDPVEKAAFAAQMGLVELAQYEQQQGRKPQQDDRLQADIAKTMIREGSKTGRDMSQSDRNAVVDLKDAALESKGMRLEEDRLAHEKESAEADRQQEREQAAADRAHEADMAAQSSEGGE